MPAHRTSAAPASLALFPLDERARRRLVHARGIGTLAAVLAASLLPPYLLWAQGAWATFLLRPTSALGTNTDLVVRATIATVVVCWLLLGAVALRMWATWRLQSLSHATQSGLADVAEGESE
jgi:hypothetical protein